MLLDDADVVAALTAQLWFCKRQRHAGSCARHAVRTRRRRRRANGNLLSGHADDDKQLMRREVSVEGLRCARKVFAHMRQDDAGLWLRAILDLIAMLFIEPDITLHRRVGGEIHARRFGQSRFERSK